MDRIDLSLIRLDGGTQPRAFIDNDTVDDYAEAIKNGAEFPAITVYFDGTDYWLADGFHRYYATAKAGFLEILAEIRQGDRRQAVLSSVGANAKHGLKRGDRDKRRAVETLLRDAEWVLWNNSKIARSCNVSDTFVADVRKSIFGSTEDRGGLKLRKVERKGKVYEQNTANIGKSRGEKPAPSPDRDTSEPEPPPWQGISENMADPNPVSVQAEPEKPPAAPDWALIKDNLNRALENTYDENATACKAFILEALAALP